MHVLHLLHKKDLAVERVPKMHAPCAVVVSQDHDKAPQTKTCRHADSRIVLVVKDAKLNFCISQSVSNFVIHTQIYTTLSPYFLFFKCGTTTSKTASTKNNNNSKKKKKEEEEGCVLV